MKQQKYHFKEIDTALFYFGCVVLAGGLIIFSLAILFL